LKIAIMGSGGIGGYYGAMLQNGGADVTFIARGAQLEAFRQNGIAIEGVKPLHLPKVKATDDPATIGTVDLVLFSVKLRDTETAARAIKPILRDGTAVVSLQNGVQKDDMLAPIVGRKALMGGAAYIGVSIVRPGVIRKAGTMERLVFGEFDNSFATCAGVPRCLQGGQHRRRDQHRHRARAVGEVRDPRHHVERDGLHALNHRPDPRQSADAPVRL
jgi:2-dehydropantoate 2-reductase